jgi:hypothetical protein
LFVSNGSSGEVSSVKGQTANFDCEDEGVKIGRSENEPRENAPENRKKSGAGGSGGRDYA